MNQIGEHADPITLTVNGTPHQLTVDPETPLLYILRNDLGLKGPKYGCGSEQCGACKVLIDGADVPSCHLPVKQAQGVAITTVEGLGAPTHCTGCKKPLSKHKRSSVAIVFPV